MMTPRTTTTWLWAVLVALAATALLSTAWHLSSLEPRRGNAWHTLTRWRTSDPLAYRRQIQLATTQPRDPEPAFDHVYVLSLPAREDRRADMRQLAQALAIDITFVDAADREEPFLQWIAERVAESRKLRRQVMAEARQVAPESIGGMSIGSDWVTPFPGNLSSSQGGAPARFPPYPTTKNYGNRHWVSHLEALAASGGRHTSLRPSNPTLNVTSLLWDPLEPLPVRQVHKGVISTYWGQTRAIKRMLENGDKVALILEDDVDVEWDLMDGFWDRIERRLPRRGEEKGEYDWDVTFLGHCWGGEFQQPQYLHPLLHRSTGPMCLHGYALTARGAHRLLSHMLDPWSAFSTAVDLVIPSLLHIQSRVRSRLLESFSVVPPLIVQRKDGPSDLQRGNGSKWRGLLRDSTVERIRRDRGEWNDDWEDKDEDEERWVDPALKLRCAPV
ncbi:hypothetical protein JCM8115_004210 [Rhodotorula mucilaginosa]